MNIYVNYYMTYEYGITMCGMQVDMNEMSFQHFESVNFNVNMLNVAFSEMHRQNIQNGYVRIIAPKKSSMRDMVKKINILVEFGTDCQLLDESYEDRIFDLEDAFDQKFKSNKSTTPELKDLYIVISNWCLENNVMLRSFDSSLPKKHYAKVIQKLRNSCLNKHNRYVKNKKPLRKQCMEETGLLKMMDFGD